MCYWKWNFLFHMLFGIKMWDLKLKQPLCHKSKSVACVWGVSAILSLIIRLTPWEAELRDRRPGTKGSW